MFISKETVPITLDDKNFIFIKPKLNYGEMKRVRRALLQIKSVIVGTGPSAKEEISTEYDFPAYQMQLLVESVVSWNGPDFEGRACNAASIAEMDPADPLLDRVVTEVAERNKTEKREDPKGLSPGGEALSPPTLSAESP